MPLRAPLLLAALACALALAPAAAAAPLNWEGTALILFGQIPELRFPGGGVATVNGSSGGLPAPLSRFRQALSRGLVTTEQFTFFVTDPETAGNSIASVEVIDAAFATGSWRSISGTDPLETPATLALSGLAKICLFDKSCTQFLSLQLTEPDTTDPNRTRKGVGIGGLLTVGAGGGAIRVSLEAAPWTVHTVTVTDNVETALGILTDFTQITRMGFAHGPSSVASSTAQPGGAFQVVTPAQVRTNLPLGSNAKVAAAVTMLVHFVPEPGLLLLLSSGLGALAILGFRRR